MVEQSFSSTCSEGSDGLEESAVGTLSLVVLALDLGGLGNGVLVDVLESILVLSSLELIRLPGESLLVGLQVGIGSGLRGGGGSEISTLSGGDEVGLNLGVISLERSIESSLLSFNGGLVGSLGLGESSLVLVGGTSEFSGGSTLGSTSSGISSGSGGGGTSGGSGILGVSIRDGRSGEMLVLGNVVSLSLVEVSLIVVVGETLVAPFTTAVITDGDGLGVSEEKSSNSEF